MAAEHQTDTGRQYCPAAVRFNRRRVVHALREAELRIDGRVWWLWPVVCGIEHSWSHDVTYYDAGAQPVTCRRCAARAKKELGQLW